MPFKSEAQRRFMYAKHPNIAKKWEKHTPKGKKLPEKVSSESFASKLDAVLVNLNEELEDHLQSLMYKVSRAASSGAMPFDVPRASESALAAALGVKVAELRLLRDKGLISKVDDGILIDKNKFQAMASHKGALKAPTMTAPKPPPMVVKNPKANVVESAITKRLNKALKRV